MMREKETSAQFLSLVAAIFSTVSSSISVFYRSKLVKIYVGELDLTEILLQSTEASDNIWHSLCDWIVMDFR